MTQSTASSDIAPPARRARGRPTADEGESLNERLITIALRHFTQHGFDGTSIEAIAREAQVTRQSIYQRYGGKQDFLKAVLQRREDRFFDLVTVPDDADPARPEAVLFDLAMRMATYLLLPERMELSRALAGGLNRYPELASGQRAAHQAALQGLVDYLASALALAGRTRSDLSDATDDFRWMISGIASTTFFGLAPPPDPADLSRRVAGIVGRFVRAIGLAPDEALLAKLAQGRARAS